MAMRIISSLSCSRGQPGFADFQSYELGVLDATFVGNQKAAIGLWHETYSMRGGIEAIYGDVPPPLGLMGFAPIRPATGADFSARSRLKVDGEQMVDAPFRETEI